MHRPLASTLLLTAISAIVAPAVAQAPAQDPTPQLQPDFGFWFEWHRTQYNEWLWALKPGNTVPWLMSDGSTALLNEWRGRHVSLLTRSDAYDPLLVDGLMGDIDAFWVRCRELCENSPPPDPDAGPLVRDRPVVVEMAEPALPEGADASLAALGAGTSSQATGGAAPRAWGRAGVALVNVNTPELELLLRRQAQPTARLPLGELTPPAIARNFFYFSEELGSLAPNGELASAYASLLMARACESLGWKVPDERRPFDRTLERFERDPTATFDRVLAPGAEPSDVDRAELWLALLVRLQNASGRPDFVERLWRATAECPPASTADQALANLVVATSAASGADLTTRFRVWRFPVDDATKARVRQATARSAARP